MKHPSKELWQEARVKWESDPKQTFESISTPLNVTRMAVSKRAAKQGWFRATNLKGIVEKAQFKADAKTVAKTATIKVGKVSGKVASKLLDPEKVAAETDKRREELAVEVRAEILDKHRADWVEHRTLFGLVSIADDFENGKKAKISAEMTTIRQKGERAAYGLDIGEGAESSYEAHLDLVK